jgi:phospholipid transport system substrate-binding protein
VTSLRAAALLIVLAIAAFGAPARAATDAPGFIADLGDRAVKVLTSTESEADREKQFRSLFDEGFDVPGIAKFVLGTYWRSAQEAQRKEFEQLFESYVIHAYTVRFSAYSGQQMKIGASRPEGDAGSLVSSQILSPGGGPPVKIDWRVNKSEGAYKITDVIVEGVSMAVTERQEFAAIIQRGGGQVEALLKLLRERTAGVQ